MPTAIDHSFSIRRIDNDHYLNYKAVVLFGAFTRQRPLATIARLTVGQFEEAFLLKDYHQGIFFHFLCIRINT